MKKILLYFLLSVVGYIGLAQTHSYNFGSGFTEVSGAGPTLTEVLSCGASAGAIASQTINIIGGSCGTTPQSVFAFNAGSGFSYPNLSTISGTYTIHLFFKFSSFLSYQRIIDFKNSTTDNGIYTNGNRLSFYPTGSVGTPLTANTFYLLTLVRNGATKVIDVYVNGVSFTTYNDFADNYVPTDINTPIIFFRDDNTSNRCEDQSGSVKYLSIKPSTSTAGEVAAIWGSICTILLPLKLTAFSAEKQGQSSVLNWKTDEEVNVSHFEIERSADGKQFTKIGHVPAVNGINEYSYQFIDKHLQPGSNLYRLKMVDTDGSFQYSPVSRVTTGRSESFEVFPNPAKDKITLRGVEQGGTMSLLNADGRILLTQNVVGHTITLELSRYPAGLYLVQYFDGTQLQQQKISKQE